MITLEIPYIDFDNNQRTTKAHFHFSKLELIELNAEDKIKRFDAIREKLEGYEQRGETPKTEDIIAIVNVFEEILMAAYGIRSEDGTRFIKGEGVREQLKQSAWYADWLFEKIQRPQEIVDLIDQLIPKDIKDAAAKAETQARPQPQDHLPKVSDRLAPKNPVVRTNEQPVVETPEEMEARIRAEIAAGQ